MKCNFPCLLLFGLVWLLLPSIAHAEVTIPDPGAYIVDTAHLIDEGRQQELERWLKELDQKGGGQIKVLTVPSLDGEDIFSFAQRQYDLWKLGDKKKSNGALITLALAEHKVRIHTGYGLEGSLPDSWCGTLSRSIAQQYFRQGKYNDGLYQMTLAVIRKVAQDAGIELTGMPAPPARETNTGRNVVLIFFFLFVVWALLRSTRHRSRRRGPVFWNWPPYNGGGFGRGLGGGMGGGGWGGGGGSFGGGSFGGGGSSGGGGGGASW